MVFSIGLDVPATGLSWCSCTISRPYLYVFWHITFPLTSTSPCSLTFLWPQPLRWVTSSLPSTAFTLPHPFVCLPYLPPPKKMPSPILRSINDLLQARIAKNSVLIKYVFIIFSTPIFMIWLSGTARLPSPLLTLLINPFQNRIFNR